MQRLSWKYCHKENLNPWAGSHPPTLWALCIQNHLSIHNSDLSDVEKKDSLHPVWEGDVFVPFISMPPNMKVCCFFFFFTILSFLLSPNHCFLLPQLRRHTFLKKKRRKEYLLPRPIYIHPLSLMSLPCVSQTDNPNFPTFFTASQLPSGFLSWKHYPKGQGDLLVVRVS